MKLNIGVIGAGISGLTTAYRLAEKLKAAGLEYDLTIYEKGPRVGGSIYSQRKDGFLYEWGPNGFLNNEAASFQLIHDLGIRDRLIVSDDSARKRFLLINGQLNQVPTAPPGFLKTKILPLSAKLRFGLEPFVWKKCREKDESVAAFVTRRFGKVPVTRMFDPLISGIYAGDVNKLSIHNTFKVFAEMEAQYGSVVKGMFKRLKQRKKEDKQVENKIDELLTASKSPMAGKLLSFKNGMGELTGALEKELKPFIKTGSDIIAVERSGEKFRITSKNDTAQETMSAIHDLLIIATPPTVAASLIKTVAPELVTDLDAIKSSTISVVSLGFRASDIKDDLNGFGYLIPRNEGIRSLGVLWSSSIFAERVEDGNKLLTVMIGGAHDPEAIEMSDSELIKTAIEDAKPFLQINGSPVMSKVIRHRLGIPQYNLGHRERLQRIQGQNQTSTNLFFAGNGYFGISANDCIRNSAELAEIIVSSVTEKVQI